MVVFSVRLLPVAVVMLLVSQRTDSQRGPPGPPGDTGATGQRGSRGVVGAMGRSGPVGLSGPVGPPGPPGPAAPGSSGTPGPAGPAGVPGSRGLPGRMGATGMPGSPGPAGATGDTGQADSQNTPDVPDCDGPVGPPGRTGATGATGGTGFPGFPGSPGPAGPAGYRGPKGPRGPPGGGGIQGPPGPAGAPGPRGVHGPSGFPGSLGRRGAIGATGATGAEIQAAKRRTARAAGCPGPKGQPGFTGMTGIGGRLGFPGPPGPVGPPGSPGVRGDPGPMGHSSGAGIPGPPGRPGFRGFPGPAGPAGPPGARGHPGLKGVPGVYRRVSLSEVTVESVDPLFGPLAGGTEVTITGRYISRFTVTAVYFGQHKRLPLTNRNALRSVVVTTPRTNSLVSLSITVELKDGTRHPTGHEFVYRQNPRVTNIVPRNHLIAGGTEVTVTGTNLDSVANPRIILSVVITHFSTTLGPTPQPCRLPQANPDGTKLLCRMPVVRLPGSFKQQVERSRHGTIGSTEGPGVARYVSPDGPLRIDVFVGLKLDGLRTYQNISAVNPGIKMQFAVRPNISCPAVAFNPDRDNAITIQGRHLLRGSRLVDFDITLDHSACVPESLTDRQVICRPPVTHIGDTYCHDDRLSLQLSIGNERYICSCVRNETSEGEGPDSGSKHLPLVIGLSVGLGVLLIVVLVLTVLIVWIVLRRRRNKTPSGSNDSIELNQDDQQHYAIGGAAAPPEDEKPPNYEPLK